MTAKELYEELTSDWFCGCGNPEAAAELLLKILECAPFYDHREELDALLPKPGLFYLVLYSLDARGYLEHGGKINGSWLTDKGTAVRDALRREMPDFLFLDQEG